MKRTKHNLSNYKLLSADMGLLTPVGATPVLPGDSFSHRTSLLVRVSPLVNPVMHPVTIRIHHWFVPYRILWDGWEDFITGGEDGLNADTPPKIAVASSSANSVHDYVGAAPPQGSDIYTVNAFYVNAYNKIFNEFYRDQHLQNEAAETSTVLRKIAWEKDYFTAARPFTQLGDEVTLPIGDTAPLIISGDGIPEFTITGDETVGNSFLKFTGAGNNTEWSSGRITAANAKWFDPKLSADLASASQVSINDFRKGFALQRYKEARARYGSRYTEYLRYLGVRSSDARLQRPEYLGGGKQTISFSEVLQTYDGSEGDSGPLGRMGGHGIAAMRTNGYRKFFEEHGVVMTLMSVRPKTVYMNSCPRELLKNTKEDWYQKELEHIGQQEVLQGELQVSTNANNSQTFGYNDRYAEYRRQPSTVAGNFRTTLADWHMARDFATPPALNSAFIECDPTKRIYADQTDEHKLWIMCNHSIRARRLVRKPGINRVI